jgi:hypothetical protein
LTTGTVTRAPPGKVHGFAAEHQGDAARLSRAKADKECAGVELGCADVVDRRETMAGGLANIEREEGTERNTGRITFLETETPELDPDAVKQKRAQGAERSFRDAQAG